MNDIRILAIESSCDETAAAVLLNGRSVLSNVIMSQIDVHKAFGGVVPEIASRKHIEVISQVVDEALTAAGTGFNDLDAIAVTKGPGLVGALLVGVSYAKGLAYTLDKPLIGVNHIEAHIAANYIENEEWAPPFMCLVVSGGHTHLIFVKDYGSFEIVGKTRDDAAGEAFDKVARAIGLGYPGGPKIDALAKTGDETAITLPRVYLEPDSLDFSFSGLKSAVLNYLNKADMTNTPVKRQDVAAAFSRAVVDVLVAKTLLACNKYNVKSLALAGGVSCNTALRAAMKQGCQNAGIRLNIPSPIYCTDNAAMVGCLGYYSLIKGKVDDMSLNAFAGLQLG